MVERKLATVLFVDLVESTELLEAHDPESNRPTQESEGSEGQDLSPAS